MVRIHYLLLVVGALIAQVLSAQVAEEVAVRTLPLASPLDVPDAQLSGLAWCQGKLLFLLQKPGFEDPEPGYPHYLYSLERAEIFHAIQGKITQSLKPQPLLLDDLSFMQGFDSFDGYEAVVCEQDELWFAIETKNNDKFFTTNIVKGQLISKGNRSKIALDSKALTVVDSLSGIWNLSDETLLTTPDHLISIHEANGTTENPRATLIDKITGKQRSISMAPIPYRITDATELDENNRFWVINYQYQGGDYLKDDIDWIAVEYPLSNTHLLEKNVERLLELELTSEGIVRTDTPPIYLQLSDENGRNWEGIVRLDDLGFLLVTDEHPETYFGFVLYSKK